MDAGRLDANLLFSEPWRIVVSIAVALVLRSVIQEITKPKNVPPFYYEFPYLPWLGSLVQFATGPREFLQRAAMAKGDAFSIQLFGKTMTFLTGSEGKLRETTKANKKSADICHSVCLHCSLQAHA